VDDNPVEAVVQKQQHTFKQTCEQFHGTSEDLNCTRLEERQDMGGRTIKLGPGQQWVEGKGFHLADEVRYMQRRAAQRQSQIVTVGQLVLFSTETGAAWLLDSSDQLAAPLARDGDPLSVEIGETDTSFTVAWKGSTRSMVPPSSMLRKDRVASAPSWATLLGESFNNPEYQFQISLARI
jgi:hypothetical protein